MAVHYKYKSLKIVVNKLQEKNIGVKRIKNKILMKFSKDGEKIL